MKIPLIPYPSGCRVARFLRREKRFSVLAELEGKTLWAHTNNTGSMLGLLRPGSEILLSPAKNPKRKLQWTLEATSLLHKGRKAWVGVNTQIPNQMLSAAFHRGLLTWAVGYTQLQREVRRGESRLDGMLSAPDKPRLWVECKNVTLMEDGVAAFPDAISERASKHLNTMRSLVAAGERAAMFYLVQRPDAQCFAPADYIDPAYAEQYHLALKSGVEAYVMEALINDEGIHYSRFLPLARSV